MEPRRNISAYRDELKGLAILWVVFSHGRFGLEGALGGFVALGYGGVDIFFFLTGFGLYRSLEKAPELGGYLRRRARRILPAYLPLCLVWLCVMLPALHLSTVPMVQTLLGNLLMIGYWANVPQMISWYCSGLVAVILLAPFVFASLRAAKDPRLCTLCWMALLTLAGVCFAYDQRLIAVARLPVFVLGMGFAAPAAGEKPATGRVAGYGAAFLLGAGLLALCQSRYPSALMDYGMYWYPFALMTLPLCAGVAWGLDKARNARRWFAPLRWLGRASFEIFLLNCGMELYCKKVLDLQGPGLWLMLTLASVALGCAYHWAVEAAGRARHA